MWIQPSVAEIAEEISQCLAVGDQAMAVRLAFRIVERFDRSSPEVREVMVELEPNLTGSSQFDALLAAVVEYSCAMNGSSPPRWVDHASRFLDHFWFVANLRSLEADALANSPISFTRRGVFVCSGALTYA